LLSPEAVGDYEPEIPPIGYVEATRPLPTSSTSPTTASNSSYPSNVALGYKIALEKGYSEAEWNCLYILGMRESGWNHLAKNKSSGAYGIPQSLPASKLDTHGDRHDPEVQIRWFIDYVKNRYGTACKALQFSYTNNWY